MFPPDPIANMESAALVLSFYHRWIF